MTNLVTPGQARVPIGTATINGQRVDVYLNPEWARFFESLTVQTISNTASVVNGKNGIDGSAVALLGNDGGESVEFIPGPQGQPGQQGDTGLALFMLQDSGIDSEQIMQPVPDISGKASLSGDTFTGTVTAPKFQTVTTSQSATTAVATTIYTIPNAAPAIYLVSANVGSAGDTANYSAYAVIAADGASARIIYSGNAPLQTITISGLNVQSTQSSGATQTIRMTLTKIG